MLTLEAIEKKQAELAEMIAAIKKSPAAQFPVTLTEPALREGERWVSTIIRADGKRYHLILLPGEAEGVNWEDARAWASEVGGELPDRSEQAMLFAVMRDDFEPAAYWSGESHSDSLYAWYQTFDNGNQNHFSTNFKLRARAVRRLVIE